MSTEILENFELENFEESIPDKLKCLLGEPPLLEDEDRKAYWALFAAVAKDRKLQSVMDYFDVRDYVTKLWDEQRLRRMSAGLVSGGILKAVTYYLEQTNQDPSTAQT